MANEKRLIDANELITAIQGTASEVCLAAPFDAEWFTRMADRQFEIIETIKGQPTVDAVELVRGHWKEWWSEEYITYFHKCSVCGRDALTKEETCHDEVLSNYCPNCGAKMDGDGNG